MLSIGCFREVYNYIWEGGKLGGIKYIICFVIYIFFFMVKSKGRREEFDLFIKLYIFMSFIFI